MDKLPKEIFNIEIVGKLSDKDLWHLSQVNKKLKFLSNDILNNRYEEYIENINHEIDIFYNFLEKKKWNIRDFLFIYGHRTNRKNLSEKEREIIKEMVDEKFIENVTLKDLIKYNEFLLDLIIQEEDYYRN